MPINPKDIQTDPNAQFRVGPTSMGELAAAQQSVPGPGSAQADTPFSVLETQLDQLWDAFSEQGRNLRTSGLSAKEHNRQMSRMQSEYDKRKFEMTQTRGAMDVIQQLKASGDMDEAAATKAMYSLVLPREAVQAMFPKEQKLGAPGSPKQLEYFGDITKKAIKGAESTGAGWFDGAPFNVSQESLSLEYLKAQGTIGYWGANPTAQRRFDMQFDLNAKNSAGVQWNPDSTEVKALRSDGSNKLLDRFATKFTAMGQSLIDERDRQQKQQRKRSATKPRLGGVGSFGDPRPLRTAPTQAAGRAADEPIAEDAQGNQLVFRDGRWQKR